MGTQFSIQRSTKSEVTVLSLQGDLDAHTAPELEKAIEAEIGAGQNRLVVDCARLGYISSAGLGVFMGFVEDIRAEGGDLRLCGASPRVSKAFDLVGFGSVFEILSDVEQALTRFNAERVEP